MKKPNKWNSRYAHGYEAFIEHSFQREWTIIDRIPKLDDRGCSKIVMLHFPHLDNPVGMDTEEQVQPGFFHAKAGKHGLWYRLDEDAEVTWYQDAWKRCDKVEPEWDVRYENAKKRIENGDCPL
jgi:hypothetical protein